ncbi:hypothetical protein TWF696_002881 [Orbilia brochopaga]|uniref:Uncharacterized protein n=1 Tax=Orbilia brochopaga TaxID=3140254 RepID=A0AAV9U4R6_9PEZI
MEQLFKPDFFFSAKEEELLLLLKDAFAPELERLKRAYSIRDLSSTGPSTRSPSQFLFGADYDEVNRTLVSVLALRWIHNDQYDIFVGTQPESVRLSRETFDWIRAHVAKNITGSADLAVLLTAILINDLGKDDTLASDYRQRTGSDISSDNHDAILFKAVQEHMVPSIDRLEPQQRADLLRCLEVGAKFNYGQLIQAENAPACLESLRPFSNCKHVVELHFVEQILDIAGAAGHMDWTCAKKLVEPLMQGCIISHDIVGRVIDGHLGLRDGYDRVLVYRADLLHQKGFQSLDVKNDNDRALLRLLCMGSVAEPDLAALYQATFHSLDASIKRTLLKTLNADGSVHEPAVQPTYMPALLYQAVNSIDESRVWDVKKRALHSALRYLARVMTIEEEPDGRTIIIERNVLDIVKNIVQGPEFQKAPTILETADVPKETVTLTAEDITAEDNSRD